MAGGLALPPVFISGSSKAVLSLTKTSRPWLFVSIAWVVPATLAALQSFAQHRLNNWDGDVWKDVLFGFFDWLLYGFLTPIVFHFARRYPLVSGTLVRRLPLHLAASWLMCAAWAAGGTVLRALIYPGDDVLTAGSYIGWFFTSLPFGVAVYFAVLGIEHATRYFAEARERETAAMRLSAQLSEARLGALRMQLNPHFLFNTLNATLVLVRDQDTATATRMLEQLSEVLRQVLRTDRPQEVRLAQEIEFLRQYLAIEQVRFSDRLRTVVRIAPEVENAAVPDFILQPLVENALRHGIASRTEGGSVTIEARREGDDLVIAVANDGGPAAEVSPGIGLTNTRERLRMLYAERGRLDLTATPAGTVATIRVPYRDLGEAGGGA
jgi:two-component system, LytTR family, sensor kinase